MAERAVRTVKEGLKKVSNGSVFDRLARFLFSHRNTPPQSTGHSPSELMFRCTLRSALDLMKPDLQARVQLYQDRMKAHHDHKAKERCFEEKEQVHARNFGPGQKWVSGEITSITGPVSATIQLDDSEVQRKGEREGERGMRGVCVCVHVYVCTCVEGGSEGGRERDV